MTELREDQYELLYEANRMDSPILVEEDAVDAVRDVLGEALKQRRLTDPSSLSLEALAANCAGDGDTDADADADADGETVDLTQLAQTPETGSSPDALEAAEPEKPTSIDALEADDRRELKTLVEKHSMMAPRTPDYAEELEAEALEIASWADSIDEIRTEL